MSAGAELQLEREAVQRPERELHRLARSVGPLRWAMASIAARFVGQGAHSTLCFARLGDYARERLGLSARQLQELARVARTLTQLPRVERALIGNELPWSKVRLLVRVAQPEDERAWVALAREVGCRELERRVREASESGREEADVTEEAGTKLRSVSVHCSPAQRHKWEEVRELAERVSGESLSDADALECVVGGGDFGARRGGCGGRRGRWFAPTGGQRLLAGSLR